MLIKSSRMDSTSDEINLTESQSSGIESSGPRKMYLAAFSALMFSVSLGMVSAYTATATENMKTTPSRINPPNKDEIQWIGSLMGLGAFVGGLASGYISNVFGRKGSLMLASLPFALGWMCIAFANSVTLIYVGRFINGFFVGLICVTVPAYLVEISTPEIRGMLGTSFQLFICIGVLIVNCIGSFVTWNLTAIISCCPIVLAALMMFFMPESPKWLLIKNKEQEAMAAIKFLQGPNFDAAAEIVSINEDICLQPKGKITFQEFLQPTVYKPAILSVALVFFQQATGSNAVLFYTANIFSDSKMKISPDTSTIIVDAVLVLATLASSIIIDKTGRKILLIISSVGMGVFLAILGAYELMKSHNDKLLLPSYNWIPLASVMFYIVAFSIGFGPVTWLMIAEISPVRTRSLIAGAATGVCWFCVFIVTKTFFNLQNAVHDYGAYWIYAGFSVLACIFVIFCLPETKGKTFDKIQEYFQRQ